MGTIELTNLHTIPADAAAVWAVVGEEFTDVASWASAIKRSGPNEAAPIELPGAPAGGRVCQVPGFGATDERLTRFDASTRRLAYSVQAAKMPFFVSGLEGAWSVDGAGPGISEVTWTMTAQTAGVVGRLAAPLLRWQLARIARRTMRDLAAHLEERTAVAG